MTSRFPVWPKYKLVMEEVSDEKEKYIEKWLG